ncbi:hypothetical protein HMPREF1084_01756 [Clostridium butyricum 60E.3]|uniref:hypothetical protein n=1 Tax=Clostridium butyricum TaxID=1492 RepID=UPI0002D1809E|nr:hypothetical protein [Clostridium butyricum]ENZ33288.1 hypothetical protein HMPREF1084_01756 [Clostridium butyricum 60E.3]
MGNLYGGTLVIGNGFQSTFNQFASNMNRAGNQFKRFTAENTNQANKAGKAWQDSFSGATKSFDKFYNNTTSKIAKITAGFLSVKGAISGVQKILESGMEFQDASVFLKSVYGEQEGIKKFKWATKEANATPFSESEVANGLARAHSLGLKDDAQSFKMYEDLGSFAKIQGVGDLNSAIDAIVDAQAGEWVRLQTITGIKRKQLEDFANEKGLGKFTNKKGQVTNADKLMEILQAYMDEKGITGMTDKFSKTLKGRVDTLKSNFTKMLAEIGGINGKGEVEDGSLFDQACKGTERLIESVGKFAKSSSFDKIKRALGDVGEAIIKGFDYLTTHPETVDKLLKFGKAFVEFKIISTLIKPFKDFSGALGGIPSVVETVITAIKSLSGINVASGMAGSSMAGTMARSGMASMAGRAVGNVASKVGLRGLSKVALPVGLALEGANMFLNEESILRKGASAVVNGAISPFTGGEKVDGFAWFVKNLYKMEASAFNKLGWISTEKKDQLNSNLDAYYKNRTDYVNGRSDSYMSIVEVMKDAGRTNMSSPTVSIHVDKIEKDVDTDTLLTKLTSVFNKNNTRNSVSY